MIWNKFGFYFGLFRKITVIIERTKASLAGVSRSCLTNIGNQPGITQDMGKS